MLKTIWDFGQNFWNLSCGTGNIILELHKSCNRYSRDLKISIEKSYWGIAYGGVVLKTKTSSFGTSKREGHDSSSYYKRNMSTGFLEIVKLNQNDIPLTKTAHKKFDQEWKNKVFFHTSEDMLEVPDNSVGLAFTSPPYNVGKEYDEDLTVEEYIRLIYRVGTEVYRTLKKGGRYIINIANLGRKPYIPLHALFYQVHLSIGFIPSGEIIWRKASGANGSCAWGSWCNAANPCIRDTHEYLLIFNKERIGRPDKGESTIEKEEFMKATLSVWEIPPESAKRVGHPAPFPVELASRVIQLYSYKDDVILDPFAGSGSCLVSAKQLGRYYVGYEIVEEHYHKSLRRLENIECLHKKQ